jgi:hypothetical protein
MAKLSLQVPKGSQPTVHLINVRVLVRQGKLPPAVDAVVNDNTKAVLRVLTQPLLEVQFTNNSHTGTTSPQDRVLPVAYADTIGQALCSPDAGRRSDVSIRPTPYCHDGSFDSILRKAYV